MATTHSHSHSTHYMESLKPQARAAAGHTGSPPPTSTGSTLQVLLRLVVVRTLLQSHRQKVKVYQSSVYNYFELISTRGFGVLGFRV